MSIEQKIKRAKKDYPNIMESICALLAKNDIRYTSSKGEIVICDKTKREILEIVYSLPIDAENLFILVDVVSTKEEVFIRKKNSI
jgi:hypothetical protein